MRSLGPFNLRLAEGVRFMQLNQDLADVLAPSYDPCPAFKTSCTDMRWDPPKGDIPIGFAGATGLLSEIELVLVVAEPGTPFGEPRTGLQSAYDHAMDCFRTQRSPFHRNVRKILDMCWPGASLDDQWRKVWLTESVLCAAKVESGPVASGVVQECGVRYLRPQLLMLPNAVLVALGGKARDRLRALGVHAFLEADHPSTRRLTQSIESWKRIADALTRHRSGLPPASSDLGRRSPEVRAHVGARSVDADRVVPTNSSDQHAGTVRDLPRVEWIRRAGTPAEEFIQVHYMKADPSDPWTLCGGLHTTASRYLQENHVVRRTVKPVTCVRCKRSAARLSS